jgi:hypothetical protein
MATIVDGTVEYCADAVPLPAEGLSLEGPSDYFLGIANVLVTTIVSWGPLALAVMAEGDE